MRVGSLEIRVPALLAPMAAVTDLPLRTISEEYGAGLTITEFLSANALSKGAEKIVSKLTPSREGRPFGVQIFGRELDVMARAAEMAGDAGAELIDINMGCPAKRVVAGECGAALMKEPELAQEIVRAVRRAVPKEIAVSVKHRAGWDERHKNAPEFAFAMAEAGAALITVHGRTRVQGFHGTVDLDIIREVRKAVPRHVPVVGNGDVTSVASYKHMREMTGVDAVMIGRGALGNPFLFRSIRAVENGEPDPGPPTVPERLVAFERHVELIFEYEAEGNVIHTLRKAAAWYSRGLRGCSGLRQIVWRTNDEDELLARVRKFLTESE